METEIIVAIIAGCATIIAAIIAGVFALITKKAKGKEASILHFHFLLHTFRELL